VDKPICHAKTVLTQGRVRKDKGTAKERDMENIGSFFELLREKKWVLYVPEQIHRAHNDGWLCGWGVYKQSFYKGIIPQVDRLESILELLKSQNVNLKIPFSTAKWHGPIDWLKEEFADHIMLHSDDKDCPPFPDTLIVSDSFWDVLVSRFNLAESFTSRTLAWGNWVYQVRFFPVWTNTGEKSLGSWPPHGLNPLDIKEWRQKAKEVRLRRRYLREVYGLTGEYFGKYNSRKATLAVLKKAYPPEQVRRVRRQLEDKIRKDPAEVIRYAFERGLLTK